MSGIIIIELYGYNLIHILLSDQLLLVGYGGRLKPAYFWPCIAGVISYLLSVEATALTASIPSWSLLPAYPRQRLQHRHLWVSAKVSEEIQEAIWQCE